MNNVYIFSRNNFVVEHKNKALLVNKNSTLKLTDIKDDVVKFYSPSRPQNAYPLNLNNLQTCNYYRCNKFNNDFYVELIAASFDNLLQKFNTSSCEVYVYEETVRIIFKNKCYSYFFNYSNDTSIIEFEEKLYIFNNKNLIIFDLQKLTFNYLKTEKYLKKDEKLEILCKIPRNFNYFVLFSFSLKNNKVTSKKYINEKFDFAPPPYSIFYLSKYNFDDVKKQISGELNTDKLKNYFSSFENVVEIDGKHYLISFNQICPFVIKSENGVVVDID